ncbi:MAG: hypothetical protein EBR95_07915 [Verrucomicrobia bacterium]|jgi:LysM repeat protein|nr:hypothetical protein [Verrucomicrobiota bacterium]
MIETRQVTLGTATATAIATADDMPQHIYIHNQASNSSSDIFIGGQGVTITTGLEIPHDAQFQMVLAAGDTLYAIASHDSPVIDIMQIKM